jgi:predicted tellurium resistance membrane protein TerC
MVNEVFVMVSAIILAVAVMIFASNPVGDFIDRHPTLRMLALAFLILVGVVLIADGFELHIPRGYVYFAMGFSIAVEGLNLWARKRARRS